MTIIFIVLDKVSDVCLQCVIPLKHDESHLSGVYLTEGQPPLTFFPHSLLRKQISELSLDECKNIFKHNTGKSVADCQKC